MSSAGQNLARQRTEPTYRPRSSTRRRVSPGVFSSSVRWSTVRRRSADGLFWRRRRAAHLSGWLHPPPGRGLGTRSHSVLRSTTQQLRDPQRGAGGDRGGPVEDLAESHPRDDAGRRSAPALGPGWWSRTRTRRSCRGRRRDRCIGHRHRHGIGSGDIAVLCPKNKLANAMRDVERSPRATIDPVGTPASRRRR